MSLGSAILRWVPFGIATIAVTGVVHIGTILAYPSRTHDDTFARIAALGPPDTKVFLPPADRGRLPFRDAAMAEATCRYDLASGPFHVAVDALDEGLVSLGMHSRGGVPFYGLNVHAGEGGRIDLVLMTDGQKTEADAADTEPDRRELRVVAPEPRGFVMIEAPADGPGNGRAALDRVICAQGNGETNP